MAFLDIQAIIIWWTIFLILGTGFLPLSCLIFHRFFDKGYIFSKTLSVVFISYLIFLLGIMQALPFATLSLLLIYSWLIISIFIATRKYINLKVLFKKHWRIFLFEEILFLISLSFWSYIRSFNPDIHGLEKYMDYGFINSILRTEYFPPKDMWLTPFSINYYYFGHLMTAVLTKLSGLSSNLTFNLMLASVFALCLSQAFSIGANLYDSLRTKNNFASTKRILAGILTAVLVTFSGNLHIIYSLFKPYENENPAPFWKLVFDITNFPNSYWYPNATRFIYNTIHEFPIYSWVVADLHGHVLDIPIVLLTIAVLYSLYLNTQINKPKHEIGLKDKNTKSKNFWPFKNSNVQSIQNLDIRILELFLIGFLLAVMYMTNAWDGGIYFLLSSLILLALSYKKIKTFIFSISIVAISLIIFSYPYNHFFKPFASGIGILCAPDFLIKLERVGPFLFEKNFCQHSLWWQLLILYGFFYFFVISFFIFIWRQKNLYKSDIFVFLLITLSTFLILLPEFIYLKDIYPAHYRANTMFKLVFQSFIMLSLSCGYIIIRLVSRTRLKTLILKWKIFAAGYLLLVTILLALVITYPFLAIQSYYEVGKKVTDGNYKKPIGLDGTKYLNNLYPDDFEAITWLNKNIIGQPVILEAQGDSYTDFARVSSNTGLPTVLGWTVHEWLWRGSYDIPAPRIDEIKTIYETENIQVAKNLLKKHKVSYVFIGTLERQNYPNLNEEKFDRLGKAIFIKGNTKIYEIKE